jgi:cytochrome c oxidase subunit 1
MHFMGLDGVPRRYYAFTEFEFMKEWLTVNVFITWAAIIASLAQLAFLYNFFHSIFYGKKTTQNPWNSNTLEWTTPVEHLHGNWPGEIPTVYRWPYDYSKPGHNEDFIPQTTPFSETMSSNVAHDFEGNAEAELLQAEYAAKGTKKSVVTAKPVAKAAAKTAKKPAAKKKTTPSKKA